MSDVRCKKKFWFLDTLVTFNVAEAANDDAISIIEHTVPYGSSPPLHVHGTEDEIFHMLAGEARFSIGGKQVLARAGDTLVAPKGVPHTFVVTSLGGAKWLTVTSGGDFERMVRKIARPAEHEGLPPRRGAPSGAEAAALEAACRAHGISLIGPPMIVDRTQGALA
jgi:quercetin dioxygenase-like cupin family protein